MILTTFIILVLIGCFINGRRRGLLMMVLYAGTYLVSWLVARWGATALGTGLGHLLPDVSQSATYSSAILKTVNNNDFFYRGIAFMIIFTLVAWLCHWAIHKLRWIKRLPVIGTFDALAGGLLSLVIGYIILYVALVILQLWPAGWWQLQLANSGLAQFMINQTPGLAQIVLDTLN
ncbi:CvpA family protein [Limosilactobacillus sp.]|uniref:CvpA family protein n=1 Tax=Limosilactobacillus sp. TaxID=2773925 RepID=UPI0025C3310A|nr:CvpA family protein [Limosilactobacillus sp.]MCH3922438.1 CvpA family protein [Limosilactobacillus sp.]MCH3929210.1 CvpA family protein [Limosilactobacillus sp.]